MRAQDSGAVPEYGSPVARVRLRSRAGAALALVRLLLVLALLALLRRFGELPALAGGAV